MPAKTVVTGEYCETGYEILENGSQAYSAGNAFGDSQVVVPPDRGVGIRALRRYCVRTGRERARELGARWGGVERVPDPLKGEL